MKLFLDLCKKKMLNYVCGSSLTNTKIRNLIALQFIKSIINKSINGNKETNMLAYDTMFTIYISSNTYERLKGGPLLMIVYATVKELEYILKKKVNPQKYTNYNLPHSPYWQFVFQDCTIGSKVNNTVVTDDYFDIKSEEFPAGRDKNTVDTGGQYVVSIRSQRSAGTNNAFLNKDAFVGVEEVCAGEFVVPFGISYSPDKPLTNGKVTFLTLSIKNGSFIVDGKKSSEFKMTTSELYIVGKNAKDTYKGAPVVRIADNYVMTPQVHIMYIAGTIKVDGVGDVTHLNKKVGNSTIDIRKGETLMINKTIQIKIS